MTIPGSIPYRHLWRITGEFRYAEHASIERLVSSDIVRANVLLVIARTSAQDWAAGREIRPPAEPARWTRISSIASSLLKPFETARRHVRALERDGLIVVSEHGVALAPDSPRTGDILRLLVAMHDVFVLLIEQLMMVDIDGLTPRVDREPSAGDLLVRAIDVRLAGHERLAPSMANWYRQIVWGAIAVASARPIVVDPELARRYAYEATPDSLRRGVSLQAIVDALHLPYQTVWKQARQLQSEGLVRRRADGWVFDAANADDPAVAAALTSDAKFVMRMVRELVVLGLDPRAVAERYMRGRPRLLDFGDGAETAVATGSDSLNG